MKVGAAFSDYIHTEKRSFFNQRSNYRGSKEPKIRSTLLPLIAIICGIILFGKLVTLQVINGQYYQNISNNNRLRTTIIHAPRGIIVDRNGTSLVYNSPGFREVVNGKTKIIDQQTALELIAKGDKHVEVDSIRNYPFKDSMAHLIGYIGQISPNELKDPQFKDYNTDELIGKMGIEAYYEHVLKGKDGESLIEVNARGSTLRTLGQTDPIPGENITLTIDAPLQQAAYDAMKDVPKGAAIVSSPTGEILAMVSKPSFDPNIFTQGVSYIATNSAYKSLTQILTDNNNQPLLNRAIAGVYPPGSTFKLVTAAAGLESHVIDENYIVQDDGVLHVGSFSFANWYYLQYGKTEGQVNVVTAIKRSNDIFFYKLGDLLGVDALSSFAKKMGLGSPLGIDLLGETKGLVPTKDWKKQTFGENWYLGDNYHYGIGQGYLLTTPLQVNAWTQVVANGGTLYQPHIRKINGSIVKQKGILSDKTTSLLKEGMIAACSPGGVAYPLFNFQVKNEKLKIDGKNILESPNATTSADAAATRQITVACKSGTAQNGGTNTLPHAWITLFAPAYNPQVVVTVLVENSGEGSTVAAPIAKKILENWFEK